MKNLLTLLLLVISLLASGQSNNQSVEVEIKYWKSIAESNDTVAYREYLERYGEDGLYKDEALTRIALLKTSGKQTQSKSLECCFYDGFHDYIVRFDNIQRKVWLKHTNLADKRIRYNLAQSRDFYENLSTIALSHKDASSRGYGEDDVWMADEEYEYDPMKSTSARDVYFKRDELFLIEKVPDEYIVDGSYYTYPNEEPFLKDKQVGYHFRRGKLQTKCNITKKMQGYRYVAFSKDKSSFIMWFEQDNNLDGVILDKREDKRVPKEELLPKAVNYDFLNE